MINIVSYNQYEIKFGGSIEDIKKGFNVWIDITDHYIDDILSIFGQLNSGGRSLQWYLESSLKPDKQEVRLFENHIYTIIPVMKGEGAQTPKEGLHMLLGENWLVSLHSSKVDLIGFTDKLVKINRITSGRMYTLYYNLIELIIASYEQLLTPIESSLNEFKTDGNIRPENIFEYVTQLSQQISSVKPYFKNIRSFLNVIIHNAQNGEELKYIDPPLRKVEQFVDLVKSYEIELHSIHRSHIAHSTLKMRDKMRVFTMYFAISLVIISTVFLLHGLDIHRLDILPAGFILVIIMIACVEGGLLLFFIKKQWIFVRKHNGSERVHYQKASHQDNHTNNRDSHISYHVWKNGE
jgi:magnesium transporter